jgi:hypothetical protein
MISRSPQAALLLALSEVTLSVALAAGAGAQASPRPEVPDAIQAPAGEEVLLQAHAVGSQIYVCQAAADGKSGWTLKAPDAELRDQHGELLGRHYAGPTWKHKDGSEVTGKATARADAPAAGSIPWLLVTATGHSGQGVFSSVTSIQRVHTKGGLAPSAAGCSQGAEVKSPYEADYYFYRAGR